MTSGCINSPEKCIQITGTDNCLVLAECYCGSMTASAVGNICTYNGFLHTDDMYKSIPKCDGGADSNCIPANDNTDCII